MRELKMVQKEILEGVFCTLLADGKMIDGAITLDEVLYIEYEDCIIEYDLSELGHNTLNNGCKGITVEHRVFEMNEYRVNQLINSKSFRAIESKLNTYIEMIENCIIANSDDREEGEEYIGDQAYFESFIECLSDKL